MAPSLRYFSRPAALPLASSRAVVVEASAGTGKTYFLEHRIVDLLISTEATLPTLLVVTFTEKATAELRRRIRQIIDEIVRSSTLVPPPGEAWCLDDRVMQKLTQAKADVGQATISTIHGFCQRVLAEDAFFAGRLFEQTRVADAATFWQVYYRLLRERFASDAAVAPCLRDYLTTEGTVEDLGEALLACVLNAAPLELAASRDEKTQALRAAVGACLPYIQTALAQRKLAQGQFDFNDLLQGVWQALEGEAGPQLAARLRAKWPWALIDEFQDTDDLQWQIFGRVWAHPEAQSLTIVGDPKQAIYAFRGANVQTYLRAKAELLQQGAELVTLAQNHRSTDIMVRAVNAICGVTPDGPLGPPLLDGDVRYETPSTAAGHVVAEGPAVVVWEMGEAKTPAASARRQLALQIAAEIEALAASPLAYHDRRGAHVTTLADIMVVTPRKKQGDELAEVLLARGIPCVRRLQAGLFATDEAREVLAVLTALAYPRHVSKRVAALRTGFFAVPWADVPRVLAAPDQHPLMALFFRLAALAQEGRYDQLFHALRVETDYGPRALALGQGERKLTNLDHVFEVLASFVGTRRVLVTELVEALRRWVAEGASELEGVEEQRVETDRPAVQILTVHKAKGLEAPIVFWFGGNTGGGFTRDVNTYESVAGRRVAVGKFADELKPLVEEARRQEDQRLAYVALTRAKLRMYLPVYPPSRREPAAPYAPIAARLAWLKAHAAAVPEAQLAWRTVAGEAGMDGSDEGLDEAPAGDAAATITQALATLVVAPAPRAANERHELAFAQTHVALWSYSRLAARFGHAYGNDATRAGEDEWQGEPTEPLPTLTLPPGKQTGLMLHAVLETLPWAVAALDREAFMQAPEARALVARQASHYGLPASVVDEALAVCHQALAAPWRTAEGLAWPPLALAREVAREVAFVFPADSAMWPEALRGGPLRPALVRGYLDVVVRFAEQGLWVIDYKSDWLGEFDVAARAQARVAEAYGAQAAIYADAVARMGLGEVQGVAYYFLRHQLAVAVPVEACVLPAPAGGLR